MKKIRRIGILFLFLAGAVGGWVSGDVPAWVRIHSKGSQAVIGDGGKNALFEIRRISSAPKKKVDSHGYAYLLSSPISLPPDWKRIELSGRWWYEKGERNNYPELTMFVMGKYPDLTHGLHRRGVELVDYMRVAYDTWNGALKFSERGRSGPARDAEIPRKAPLSPRAFRIVIRRDEGGRVGWEYMERENGHWTTIRHTEDSRIFEGTNGRRIHWKIGAWCSWEKPIGTRVHFDRLSYRIYRKMGGTGIGEGSIASGADTSFYDHRGDTDGRSSHHGRDGSGEGMGLPGGLGGPEMTSCLKMVPHPGGFVRLRDRSTRLMRSLAGTGWQEESYRGREDAVFLYNFFQQVLPRGYTRLETVTPDDTLHAYLGWELPAGEDRIIYRVWISPEAGKKSRIDIGCKWVRGE